jgi:hypothetical protein
MNAPMIPWQSEHPCEPSHDRAVLIATIILVPLGSAVGWIIGNFLALLSL